MFARIVTIVLALAFSSTIHALPSAGPEGLSVPDSHEHLGAAINLPDRRYFDAETTKPPGHGYYTRSVQVPQSHEHTGVAANIPRRRLQDLNARELAMPPQSHEHAGVAANIPKRVDSGNSDLERRNILQLSSTVRRWKSSSQ